MTSNTKVRIGEFLNQEIGPKKIDQRIVSLFLKQLSLLLGSGLSLDDSLNIIKNQNLDKSLSNNLSMILNDLGQGISVSEAFDKRQASFDAITLAFINSGDKSGKLSDILEDLSIHITEETDKKSQIKQAFIYPIILLVVTILVVVAMMVFVLPTFVSVFESSGQDLPKPTRILLSISNFLINHGLSLLIAIVFIILSLVLLRKNRDIREKIDEFLFKSILFKKFRTIHMEYQMSSLLSILRKGDIDIVESMEIIKKAFNNEYVKVKIDLIKDKLISGKNLSQALLETGIFSNLLISMVKVGEDSGDMVGAMEKTKEYLSNEYLFRLKKISQMIEPILIIFMSIIVGFVVFSVAIPMFDSVNNIDF